MTKDAQKLLTDAADMLLGLSLSVWLDGQENSRGSVQRQCGDISVELRALLAKDGEA